MRRIGVSYHPEFDLVRELREEIGWLREALGEFSKFAPLARRNQGAPVEVGSELIFEAERVMIQTMPGRSEALKDRLSEFNRRNRENDVAAQAVAPSPEDLGSL